ncbi:MAG: RdgB/HAM1 family non-canonical purine NTP pyrophosphatase [Ignavibacteria bacterium]|nr:RdgB/HAM1 family non-canonical purine NTP pyrophosphatase [Ignavibacteria bacterium]
MSNIEKIILASNNKHKISELKSILNGFSKIQLLSLEEANIFIEVEETGDTLNKNAFLKALEIFNITGIPVIADDSGLFVDALNGEPGVYSSRYAGLNATYSDNCEKLISELKKKNLTESKAEFRTVICFIDKLNNEKYFEGIVKGKIITEQHGDNGFGYDPLFIPEGVNKTFAQLTDEEKNKLSHRANAVNKFTEYLKNLIN